MSSISQTSSKDEGVVGHLTRLGVEYRGLDRFVFGLAPYGQTDAEIMKMAADIIAARFTKIEHVEITLEMHRDEAHYKFIVFTTKK